MKYGSRTCYGSKVVVKVKGFFVQTDQQTDVQTNRQAKHYMPPESEIPGGGGHKKGYKLHNILDRVIIPDCLHRCDGWEGLYKVSIQCM